MKLQDLSKQFQATSGRDPWLWPAIPKYTVFTFIAVLVVVVLWFVWLQGYQDDLDNAKAQETQLRTEFSANYRKAVNLEALRSQREQVEQYVSLLEKQLPSKAEMAALLSDINLAGIGRGLQFDLFKPGATQVKDYYAELPIQIEISGSFDAIGEFVSDLAHLSRIVTLGDIEIESKSADASKSGSVADSSALVMKATAKTYRYLDAEEVLAQAQARARQAAGR